MDISPIFIREGVLYVIVLLCECMCVDIGLCCVVKEGEEGGDYI